MADASAVAASITKFEALTAGNFPSSSRPPIFFDEAPQTYSGSQLRPTFVVIKDNGMSPSYVFGQKGFEITELDFEVYAERLADVDAIVLAIRFNGGAYNAGSGFDFGTFTGLATGLTTHKIRHVKEQRFQKEFGHTSQLIHGCRLSYRITLLRS